MSLKSKVGGLVPSYELQGPGWEKLTISMAECEGLVLVTFARNENLQDF